jgi:hypothetical protein
MPDWGPFSLAGKSAVVTGAAALVDGGVLLA